MMDEGTELSVTIAQIVQKLKGSNLHSQLERQAKECLQRPEIQLEDLKEDVKEFLKKSVTECLSRIVRLQESCVTPVPHNAAISWETKLQNAVYRELNVLPPPSHPEAPAEHIKEPLAYMRKAQGSWEKRILKSLNSMCTELSIPLARKRPVNEQKELLSKWNEMGTDEPDLSHFRPVYAPKDFLEVLINLRNPNYDSSDQPSSKSHWGLIQVPLKVKDIPELRESFAELGLNSGQLGIDDTTQVPADMFESEHAGIGRKVLIEQDSAAAEQYIRQGCPNELRAELWALILNATNEPEIVGVALDPILTGLKLLAVRTQDVEPQYAALLTDVDILYYEQLKSGVLHHDLLVDNLIYKDVKLTASNDDYYFVFEDYLYQVLLCFSRDTVVLEHFNYNSATPPKSYIQGKLGLEDYAVVYPPNGVIPFHGFSMYVAPLCFLYNEPSKLYTVFREMYVRYFFRLHSISSFSSGIVSLCLQFESLLQTHLPQLFYHLREIGAQPLRIAFKWMVRAFSGYLATDQLLLLWDRVLGYNSLEILAVLAAAVFAFRAQNLMEVTSLAAAEAVLADLSTLKVMPLLQIFLFATIM